MKFYFELTLQTTYWAPIFKVCFSFFKEKTKQIIQYSKKIIKISTLPMVFITHYQWKKVNLCKKGSLKG